MAYKTESEGCGIGGRLTRNNQSVHSRNHLEAGLCSVLTQSQFARASSPLIQGGSRMRTRAAYGSVRRRSAMTVPPRDDVLRKANNSRLTAISRQAYSKSPGMCTSCRTTANPSLSRRGFWRADQSPVSSLYRHVQVAVNRRLVVRPSTFVPYVLLITGIYFRDAGKPSRAVGDLTRSSIEVTPAL